MHLMTILNVRQMPLGKRIGLVGCLILITVTSSLFYFISKGFSKDIAFADLERTGNTYQRPLEQLLDSLASHELAARRSLAGDSSATAALTEASSRTDAAIEELRKVDAQIGAKLQFTPEGLAKRKREHCQWKNVRSEWESLRDSQKTLSIETSDKQHDHLRSDIRTMIAHAGDTSNLILDSDLDSYYLMDVTLVTLPQTQDRLADIERASQDIYTAGKLPDAGRIQLAVNAALLKESDLDRAMGDFQTSLNEDQNFYGVSPTLQQRIPPASATYAQANNQLLGMMQHFVDAPSFEARGPNVTEAAETARKASFDLWWTSAQELDTLLETRIEHLKSLRLWALIWTALALFLSFGFAAHILRLTIRALNRASVDLHMNSVEIATATQEIASSAQSLASGASDQAASIEEISASSEEIRSIATRNSDNASNAVQFVASSAHRFADANRSLEQMVATMGEIRTESSKISGVIKVIDEIAFQTNLLALNAAVEAARAGEAGMGFAVVADEVRNLAQRCATAAKETAFLIEGSIARANKGTQKVSEVASAIRIITEDVSKITDIVKQVNQASQEQTRGVEQVSKALSHLEAVTQRNAASAEESASCAEELNSQSTMLKSVIREISLLVGGNAHELRADSESAEPTGRLHTSSTRAA